MRNAVGRLERLLAEAPSPDSTAGPATLGPPPGVFP